MCPQCGCPKLAFNHCKAPFHQIPAEPKPAFTMNVYDVETPIRKSLLPDDPAEPASEPKPMVMIGTDTPYGKVEAVHNSGGERRYMMVKNGVVSDMPADVIEATPAPSGEAKLCAYCGTPEDKHGGPLTSHPFSTEPLAANQFKPERRVTPAQPLPSEPKLVDLCPGCLHTIARHKRNGGCRSCDCIQSSAPPYTQREALPSNNGLEVQSEPLPSSPSEATEQHDWEPSFYDVGECIHCDGDEFDDRHGLPSHIQALIQQRVVEARIEELKRALYKGYFIPEMEVYAEDRIAELTPNPINNDGDK